MKKRLVLKLVTFTFICVSQFSCEPDPGPQFVKKFRIVINDKMFCDEEGDNCALIGGVQHITPDKTVKESGRVLLNKFYKDASFDNTRHFFENENWQTIFPPKILNPNVYTKIVNSNYATIINSCDSSIMFVFNKKFGTNASNLIFAFQRTDLNHLNCIKN
jgi:hypothetical protein